METQELFKSDDKENRKRPLIAYAFLAQTSNADGDLISGLTPIFKPIAATHANQKFCANEFAGELNELYGIDIHPWAVDDLTPRLEKANLIRKIKTSEKSFEYYYNDIQKEFNDVTEADIKYVLQEFANFSRPILQAHQLNVTDLEMEDQFLAELLKMDFHSIQLKPDRSKEDVRKSSTLALKKTPEKKQWEEEVAANAKMDVLCSAFIVDTHQKNKALYELIVRIASGALISEVVLNFQTPATGVNLSSLNVVFDAPLVMSILDLTSEQEHKYANSLLEKLIQNKAKICIFQHSVEEMHSNLKSVLNRFEKGTATGATARRLANTVFKAYVLSVFKDIQSVLVQKNIKVIQAPSSTSSYQYLSQDEQDSFRTVLGIYENPTAQERDAASMAAVVRLRQGKAVKASQFQNSQYIFITRNPWIPEKVLRFLVKRKILADNDTPPVISDRYLAGILWVMFGGKSEEFTRYRLLANCTAALEPRNDVVQKTNKFLKDLDADKAEHFMALMTTQRAGQHLMQMTLGESLYVSSTHQAEQILEALKETLTEDQSIKHESELKEIRSSHESELQKNSLVTKQLIASVANKEDEILSIKDELSQKDESRNALILALRQERLNTLKYKSNQIQVHIKDANDFKRSIISAIEIVATILTLVCGLSAIERFSTDYPFLPYLSAIVLAIIFYFTVLTSPEKFIYKKLNQLREKRFIRDIQRAGLLKDLEAFDLDLETGVIRIKNSELAEIEKIGS